MSEIVDEAATNFYAFCVDLMDEDPWHMQVEIAQAIITHKRVCVKSCNGAGKTWLAARVLLWGLLTHYNAVVVSTAPSNRQVEFGLWKEVAIAWRRLQAKRPGLFGGQLFKIPKLEINKEWFAFGFSTVDPNNFQGIHAPFVLIIFDEAGGVKAPLWEPLDGNLVGEDCHFFGIGNPTDPTAPFYYECKDAHLCKEGEDCEHAPGTKVFTISAFDTPNFTKFGITEDDIVNGTWEAKITGPLPKPELTTPAAVASFRRKYGQKSTFWSARVKGLFPEQGTDTLIWMSWGNAAVAAWDVPEHDAPLAVINVGMDVAAGGDNETIISAFGWIDIHGQARQLLLDASASADTMESLDRVLAICHQLHTAHPDAKVSLRIDANGVGKGVHDAAQRSRRQYAPRWDWLEIIGMMSGEASDFPEDYLNTRAEWWWGVRSLFETNRVAILDDEEQLSQLTSIKWRENAARRVIQIEPKEEAVKRGVKSPDRADAAMFALAKVSRESGILLTNAKPKVQHSDNRYPVLLPRRKR